MVGQGIEAIAQSHLIAGRRPAGSGLKRFGGGRRLSQRGVQAGVIVGYGRF
jgi:hypothetical protein